MQTSLDPRSSCLLAHFQDLHLPKRPEEQQEEDLPSLKYFRKICVSSLQVQALKLTSSFQQAEHQRQVNVRVETMEFQEDLQNVPGIHMLLSQSKH